MIRLFSTVALFVCLSGADSDAAKKDLDKLQGEWTMIGLEANGKETAPDRLEGTTLIIEADIYTVKTKSGVHRCRITLDPGKDPRQIDMHFEDGDKKDQTGKGIYRLEKDTLKIVRGLSPTQERPTEFGTWPGTDVFMVTWKRK
jgi:uncharacterized protein (TIGR03067 family)